MKARAAFTKHGWTSVKLFVFDDKTLNNMGYSFDLSNNEKFLIVNKEKTNKNSKEFLVIINQIIKDNLFNLNPIIWFWRK